MNILKIVYFFIFFITISSFSYAQEEINIITPDSIPVANFNPNDTIANASDTTDILADSIDVAQNESSVETTITYNAKDSILLDNRNNIVKLYGEAKIVYGQIELTAAEIEINYKTQIMKARASVDSLGESVGEPVFKDGSQTYYTKEITYNFKTEKAISKGVVTQQGDANMRGEKVFKNQFDELFIQEAIYTTCNRPDPHFHIQTKKIKMIPDNKVVSGPGYLAVKGIPTPLGFPFGIFPMPNEKASGIIVPSYGEEKRRGFYLRNGGYYFAISDYVNLEVLGEIYSKGSWGLNLASQYINRYKFSGRVNLRYNNQTSLSETDSTTLRDFWINWSHSPRSKGNSRFSASVSLGTSSYNQNNPSLNLQNTVRQNFNSSVSYSNSLKGTPFNLSLRGRFQQNVNTKVVNLLFPEASLNMSRIYPFKFVDGKNTEWIEKINFSWNMNATNQISNKEISNPGFEVVNLEEQDEEDSGVIPFSPSNFSTLMQRAENGIQHSVPISTSIKAFKYFTFNPNFSYNETWYFKKLDYEWVPEQNGVRVDTLREFSRLYNYRTGASLNTNIYGTVYFKKGPVQAIRHVMRPSISMSYSPDFSADRFDYYKEVQTDSTGRTRRLSMYDGFVYGTPTAGESASMGISLSNNIEMKVKSKNDTTGDFKKVTIFDNLSVSTSYNFLADSFNLSNISFNARTKLFDRKLDVSFATTINPYIYELDSIYYNQSREEDVVIQRRRDILAWNAGRGVGQVQSARLGLSINLKPPGSESTEERLDEMDESEMTENEKLVKEFIKYNPELYVDFNIPWSLNINYNLNYSKRGFEDAEITQGIRVTGQLNLTQQWNINFQSGYDFQRKEFTQTNFGVSRNMHCWQLNFNWVPFGRYTSYNLTIQAKSSLLQDLKINRQRSWFDN